MSARTVLRTKRYSVRSTSEHEGKVSAPPSDPSRVRQESPDQPRSLVVSLSSAARSSNDRDAPPAPHRRRMSQQLHSLLPNLSSLPTSWKPPCGTECDADECHDSTQTNVKDDEKELGRAHNLDLQSPRTFYSDQLHLHLARRPPFRPPSCRSQSSSSPSAGAFAR